MAGPQQRAELPLWGAWEAEHKSHFKQLQSPGIWVSEFLNHPPTGLPEQSQPAGELGPEGDASLELSSWGPGQPSVLAPSFLSSCSQGPASSRLPSSSQAPQAEVAAALLPSFREYEI